MERKTELLTTTSAGSIFAYLNGLEGLNQTFIKRLSGVAFIPLDGSPVLLKPTQVFIRQVNSSISPDLNTAGLIDYVDFGLEGNAFLLTIGVLHYPTIPLLAELLLDRQKTYFSSTTDDRISVAQKVDVYTDCLKRIAVMSIKTPEFIHGPLEKRLKTEAWCLGYQTHFYRIVTPTQIYLNDDPQCVLTHQPICSNDVELNKLYRQFGAKWLSECITRDLVPTGRSSSTGQTEKLKEKIQERLNILFVNKQGEPLASLNKERFHMLGKSLLVVEVKNIKCSLTFQNRTELLDSKNSSSCTLQKKENELVLYLRRDTSISDYDYFDIASELARFVFDDAPETFIPIISIRLTSSLESLERQGLPVRSLLETRPHYSQASSKEEQERQTKSKNIPLPLAAIFGVFKFLRPSNKRSKYSIISSDQPPPHHTEPVVPNEDQIQDRVTTTDLSRPLSERAHRPHDHQSDTVIPPTEDFKSKNQKISRQLRRLPKKSRSYPNSVIIHNGYIRKEQYESCEVVPNANMEIYHNSNLRTPLFVEKGIKITSDMIDHAILLNHILISLAEHVFELPTESLHLYRDINGSRIAFNADGALFFNLRYFEQIYAAELQAYFDRPTASNSIVTTIINFYFMVTCHELVHNINPKHDLSFISSLQQCAVEYMERKESLLASFSFNSITSTASSQF
ncbi:unnamed protein product [Adineta ricciae]|uniref:Uncharacterized protein n=1 Tax=Adineta ricciae TaxID=249248 RepID=A0A814FG91_ADIRI|nr:unnamed protein product [Adineta ricciae]CAF0982935.1 unnamed protein product [Adineta ricciae]